MPKAEKGTPKDIANRMKAKGLQKLKFYCQMCEKQCRDENGFKCHMTSDSHLRQMKLFRDNSTNLMTNFSREFENAYIDTLRRRHGTQRMNANYVYQEVIQDKVHVHMNATKWATLTDFVQYLGKHGICVVEETERGWYVTYVERDATLLSRQETARKRAEADRNEEKMAAERREVMRMEAARALDRAGCEVERKASEIGNREGGAKLELKLGGISENGIGTMMVEKKRRKGNTGAKISLLEEDDDDEEDESGVVNDARPDVTVMVQRKSNEIPSNPPNERRHDKVQPKMPTTDPEKQPQRDETSKRQKHDTDDSRGGRDDVRKDYWLQRNIIVRIISKSLAKGEYYKRKAIVDKVIDKYEAEVEVLESSPKARDGGDILRIDQEDLETVIPKELGEKVRIVNGKYRGQKARVEKLDKREYRAELRIVEDDKIVVVDYEDFSKIA
ncbi:hypothetical protein ACHAWU_001898 [Discostella pseudostelligera]|uniref:C2H2-type domain-containing protein n=1 Tax=Discostella pseudostelligera TaxID=259834 RepID=A0ABD3MWK6_9STRA